MNDDDKEARDKKLTLSAWDKHEKIAMHFNDLILKVRIQALGALAAIITLGGALIHNKGSSTAIPWGLVTAFSVSSLLFGWPSGFSTSYTTIGY